MPDTHDFLASIDDLERRHDGPLAGAARRLARAGSAAALLRLEASGQATFFRHMARRQIALMRARRRDGSFYPALIDDLALYRREARRWRARIKAEPSTDRRVQ